MRLTAALFMFALLSNEAAFAKCPFAKYTVEGRISVPSGVNAAQVRIYLFLDGAERTSDYPGSHERPDYSLPEPEGSFRVEAWLSTASARSRISGEKCDRVETSGEIILLGDDVYAKRVRISFSQSVKQIRRRLHAVAEAPPIVLESIPPLQTEEAPPGG
jgi:hypothetical protein